MLKLKYGAIGVIEISFYVNAVVILDAMTKASDVELVGCYKTLGGRLIQLVISGTTSQITAAIDAAKIVAGTLSDADCLKVAINISNPHPEILRFVNL